jgi:hypothetical protein
VLSPVKKYFTKHLHIANKRRNVRALRHVGAQPAELFSMKRTLDNAMHLASGPTGREMARCTLENARQAFEAIHPHD